MYYLLYVNQPKFSTIFQKEEVKRKSQVTMVIRYTWYLVESRLSTQAQFSLYSSIYIYVCSNWNYKYDKWAYFR